METNLERSSSRKEKITTFLTHLICISILFILPEMLNTYGRRFQLPMEAQLMLYAKSFIFILVFYINYYFIIDQSFKSKRYEIKLIGLNLIVVVLALWLIWWLWDMVQPFFHGWRRKGPEPDPGLGQMVLRASKILIRDLVMIVLTIGLAVALKLSDRWTAIQSRSREIMAARKEEELENLKQQLNPHFLFNTLNSIYALIAISPDTAQTAVHKLSQMLRYVLYEDRATVELSKEFDFVRNYVSLMRMRLSPGMELREHIDENGMGKLPIAPLIFITLIENAFKHGITGKKDDVISIDLTASENGTVICEVRNNVSDNGKENKKEGGIGLQNLRRRLELLYPGKFTLEPSLDDRSYSIVLTLNLM